MSKKIDKLTDAQIAKFPEYVKRWTEIGLCCDPMDREAAKKAVNLCYTSAGLSPPKHIVFSDGPISAAIIASMLKNKRDSVRASVRASVWDSVRASVWASVWDSVRASVGDSVKDMLFSSHEAGFFSFYSYMREELRLEKQTSKLQGLLDLSRQVGWWAPYKDVAVVQERHKLCNRDLNGRLHCDNGMAVQYRDGWGVYAIRGVRVPERVVMNPQTIAAQEIHKEINEEVRAIMIERLGWTKYLTMINAKCLDVQANEIEGTKEAIFDAPDVGQRRLVATCPTGRIVSLGIPRTIKTCKEARKWLSPFRDQPDYRDVVSRT